MSDKLHFTQVKDPGQIRETARLADIIWHECFADILSPEQIAYMVDKFQSEKAMTAQMAEEGYEYYLCCEGDTPIGYIGVRPGDGLLMLSKLYLLAEYRGKGYARQAIEYAEQLGREKGCTGVWLTVNRYNERAIAVYRKTGFKLTREQKQDIGGGYIMDDFIFEKPL